MHEYSLRIFTDISDIAHKGKAYLKLAKTILLCVIWKRSKEKSLVNRNFGFSTEKMRLKIPSDGNNAENVLWMKVQKNSCGLFP